MKRQLILLLIIFSTFATNCFAQKISCGNDLPDSLRSFNGGEKLNYGVSYSALFLNMSVADIEFKATREMYSSEMCYRVSALAKTKSFFNFFFKMEDSYDSWMICSNLSPLKAVSNIKEGSYRFRSSIDFNWSNKEVYTEGRNLKSDYWSRKTMSIGDCSADALSMFYNLRSADLSGMHQGDTKVLNLVFEDTLHNVELEYLGKEVIKVKSMGKRVRTLKFSCGLATSDGESFKDGDKFLIWLTDDRNRIPVYLESPIRVGKVFASLESYDGIRYPLECILER